MDKITIRSNYESCLNALARISAYASSTPISITEVHERQDALATEDLVNFCIHARRLAESTGLNDHMRQIEISMNDKRAPLSLGKIMGFLIHHDILLIIRCKTRFEMFKKSLEGETGDAFFKKVKNEIYKNPYSEPMTPLVLFQSDRSDGPRLLNLAQFLRTFSEKIMLEVLITNKWLQDDLFKDMNSTEAEARQMLSRIT
ncbi:MAG: hypothetical protein CMH30_07750 [Micavibrio sp.]|nr:hypothetical protein [Micavibrio sp.]|tara:strand:+ start:159 stop:761 length:603 start_codon:yes stop_codon:yes gene_type:complete